MIRNKDSGPWVVYGLLDPRTRELRYVGTTCDIEMRLREHDQRTWRKSSYSGRWLKSLRSLGLKPLHVILESGSGPAWRSAEKAWIWLFRNSGFRLTNTTDGGDGTAGYQFTEADRNKISAANKGRTLTDTHRARIGDAHRGRVKTPEHMEKLHASRRGKPISDEHKAAVAAAHLGRQRSAESVERTAAAHRGKKRPIKTRDLMSAAWKASAARHAHVIEMAERRRGKSQSAATQAKRSASIKQTLANKRLAGTYPSAAQRAHLDRYKRKREEANATTPISN